MWIDVDNILVNDPTGDTGVPEGLEDIAKCMATPYNDDTVVIENELRRIERGFRWHRVYDAEEDGEPLRYFLTNYFLAYGPSISNIAFNFVLTHAQMNQPDYVELREIIAREIDAARLEPFVSLEAAAAGRAWGILSRVNFADMVKLVLPDYFMLDEDEEAARSPERPGGIDVRNEEITLCGESDDELVTVSEDHYVHVLRGQLGAEAERASFRRLPDGALAYLADDAPAGTPPMRHRWWNICFTHGKARLTTVTLRPSATGDGRPPDPAFVRYLDGAVRRAQFPNFGDGVDAY